MTPPFSIDAFFEEAMSRSLDEHDRRLWCAIREQASGGKRFRPRLLLSMYGALGGADQQVASAVADAVELLHASFLIHDDLIDGDHMRRGRPNVSGAFSQAARRSGAPEKKGQAYGEAAAILAGDLALAGAMRGFALCGAPGPALVRLLDLVDEVLHRSAAGELADVRVSFTGGELDDVLDIAAWKTAAYSFELPLQSAAILAEADDATIEGLGRAGRAIGIAFQLMDDLDGVFASAERPLSICTSPTTSSNISFVIKPGRRMVGIPSVRSTIVDSMPIPTAPPSKIIGMIPFISSATCSARVGLGLPEVLALGAAI